VNQCSDGVPGENGRRLLAISITQRLFAQMITTGFEFNVPVRCIDGLPADAVLVGAFTEHPECNAYYVFYHPSFDVVPEGERMPLKSIVFKFSEPDA
jgi:hypothetical protein